MDRITVYPGQIPLDTDFLSAQRLTQIGLAKDAETILGAGPLADGLACIPTVPASMVVQVLPGALYVTTALDAASYGTLAADPTHQVVKQGVKLDSSDLTLVAPVTSGHAINYLIQAAFSEVDEIPVVLPYYNANNPSQPYSGPENSGGAQFTRRNCKIVVSAKAGVSATSGSQETPAPDAGYVPLYVVTVAQGATSIGSGNISKHASAPLLVAKLPVIPVGVREQRWTYVAATGSANAIVATLDPVPTAYVTGMALEVKISATNTDVTTINVNGLGTKPVVRADGSPLHAGDLIVGMVARLVYDGTSFQLSNSMGMSDLESAGNGVAVYEGLDEGTHFIRSLIEGTNVTLTLVEHPTGSGRYGIRIDATGGGGGGGSNTLVNIGAGVNVYKGLNGTDDEFRTLSARDLIDVVLGGTSNNEVKIGLADVAPWSLIVRNNVATGKPAAVTMPALTAESNPAATDLLLLGKASTGDLRSVTISAVRGAAGAVGSYKVSRLGGNRTADSDVTAYMSGSPTGTWYLRGECWLGQYGATGPGEPLYDWYGLCQRTA